MITQSELKELLSYCPETGIFTWRKSRVGVKAGSIAGSNDGGGYIRIGIFGVKYRAHRLAWLSAYGSSPAKQIDHINGVRHDNRISNLRDVGQDENCKNRKIPSHNTSGHLGVVWCNEQSKWKAQLTLNGKSKTIGRFHNIHEAIAARKSANINLGFHNNHGLR